ncbi:hypothetical protein LH128_25548 [Sphingomonas sp. LH128]|nr:hypothetical protein LH128_25548 [Sphingomonas sp. LH128]
MWIGAWSAYLRRQLADGLRGFGMADDPGLGKTLERAGFIATGILRVAFPDMAPDPQFPVVEGFQFGAMLLTGADHPERYRGLIPLEGGRTMVNVREVAASINLQGRTGTDGCIAAVYTDERGSPCGITARHVVNRYRRGDRVPLQCFDCGNPARMLRSAPGLIDAASVSLPCGGPHYRCPEPGLLRPALEGETLVLHLGQSGRDEATVMASLSTSSQIKSAAIPQHFLTDRHGYPGDSGSLITGLEFAQPADLVGMYLGEADCEDREGILETYGYALDLKQAADMLGARNIRGNYYG